jgi:ABC-type nitrate/sulfonate/bicarbonate transport system substrate-binding protein
MTFGRIALLAALLAIPLVAMACGDDDDNGNGLEQVTLMLNWTPNTHHNGIYAAKEQGYYREAGLDVRIVEPAAGGVEQVVATGSADFGISIQEAVIPARAEGLPIVSIGTIIQHNDSSLMALANENIRRPRDLEGKTYGGFGGALETALIRQLVECDGGNPDRVRFVEVGNVDYLVGMEQGHYDFVWVFESWDVIRATALENREVTSILFKDHLDCIPDWYTPLFITSERMISNRPDTVRRFMEATARGYDFAMENPVEAGNALLKAAPELDRRLVEQSSEYMATAFVDEGRSWGLQDREIWAEFEQFLREAGLTRREVNVDDAFTNDFLPGR